MNNLDNFVQPSIYSVKVMSTKTNTTIYTFKVAQTSPEKALAFVTDQLGLVGSTNYKVCVGKSANVYMPKGG